MKSFYWLSQRRIITCCTNTNLLLVAPTKTYCWLHQHRLIAGCTNENLLLVAATKKQTYCRLHQRRLIAGCTNADLFLVAPTQTYCWLHWQRLIAGCTEELLRDVTTQISTTIWSRFSSRLKPFLDQSTRAKQWRIFYARFPIGQKLLIWKNAKNYQLMHSRRHWIGYDSRHY